MEYKIVSHTPTSTLLTRLLQKYAGQSVNIQVAYLRVKDANGTVLGQVSVAPGDWSGNKIQKTVTISTAGTMAYFSLDSSDGAELYKYTLPSTQSVKVGDKVTITWTLTLTAGTTVYAVNYVLENIEGTNPVDLKIAKAYTLYHGQLMETITGVTVSIDTTNMILTITISWTPNATYNYDEVQIGNSSDRVLFKVNTSGSVTSGTPVSITIQITIST